MTTMTITMTRAELAEAVRAAVDSTVTRHGSDGCAGRLACEFGDHPDLAVCRVTWVRQVLETATLQADGAPRTAGCHHRERE